MKTHLPVGLALLLALCGCSTFDFKADTKMKQRLDEAMQAGMTAAQIQAQAGLPAQKAPRDNRGETWTYQYQRQEVLPAAVQPNNVITPPRLLDYHLTVTLDFNPQGVLSGWAFNGNTSAFPDLVFLKLKVSPPAKVAATPAPVQAAALPPEKNFILELTTNKLKAALRSACLWEPDLLQQMGPPQEIQPGKQAGERHYVYHYEAPSNDPAQPQRSSITIQFDQHGRMQGYSVRKLSGVWLMTPFTNLQLPEKPAGPGVWVATAAEPRAMVWFRAFPADYAIRWQGATQPMPAGPALAHGKGVVRMLNAAGAELGCYVGYFEGGHPCGALKRIKLDAASPAILGLQLGDQPWGP